MNVHVHLLPQLLDPPVLQGAVAVVIDVLRATTTIIHALANGALTVYPCSEVDEARQLAAALPAGTVVLGGERHGERIAGFDLDNSPLKYTSDAVSGKHLVFTTTNGTRALQYCRNAARVLIGAFVNREALVEALRRDGRPVHLVCAGTDGHITLEDVLFAGAVAAGLLGEAATRHDSLDDETRLAVTAWQAVGDARHTLLHGLRHSRGGLNLIELGFDADIDRAAELDLFPVVPELDLSSFQIKWA